MALEINEVLCMSLDDYIAKTSSSNVSSVDNSSGSNSFIQESNSFKSQCRNNKDSSVIDCDEYEDDLEIFLGTKNKEPSAVSEGASCGIWHGPSINTDYIDLDYMEDDAFNLNKEELTIVERQKSSNMDVNSTLAQMNSFDLRERINNINGNSMPNKNSQQWRLMRPNNLPERPAGMPPLVPMKTPFTGQQKQQTNQRRHRNRRWGKRGWGGMNNSFIGCGGNGSNNRFGNGNNFNGCKDVGVNNYGPAQHNNQPNNEGQITKAIQNVLEQLNSTTTITNGSNRLRGSSTRPQNLVIERPSSLISLSGSPSHMDRSSSKGFSANGEQIQTEIVTTNKSSNNLRALLGIKDNFTLEEMPLLASKFLDFLKTGGQTTIHKPIYDMKIQKEIHELQNKPLLYKCPGGEVVSSDGAGINNCQILPKSSGVSMNYRFA